MKNIIKNYIKNTFLKVGLRVEKVSPLIPVEFKKIDTEIFNYIIKNELTMVSEQKLIATILACKYAIETEVKGDFVECGVAMGGNSIAAAMIFKEYKSNKKVFLFDTFAGMTKPTDLDIRISDKTHSLKKYEKNIKKDYNSWCYAPLKVVKDNFAKAGLNPSDISFIQGDVCETLQNKNNLPNKIAVLRLDTDWYESSKIELEILYPILQKKGILLIDDYGHWEGQKKAVDEFFDFSGFQKPFFQFTDMAGRSGIKY